MFNIAAEIIATEITSWDSTIRVYKKCADLLKDLEAYYSTKDMKGNIEKLRNEIARLNKAYEAIYEIIGDSTKEYLTGLGVPDPELIAQLGKATPETIKNLESQLQFKPDTATVTPTSSSEKLPSLNGKAEISNVDEKVKLSLMTHALTNLMCCEQFFKLCELRKKALLTFKQYNDSLKEILEILPEDFHVRTSSKYKFGGREGFEIDAIAIAQRFVKYGLLGGELQKTLPKPENLEKENFMHHVIGLADILMELGKAYATWDNKARLISEKADPRKQTTQLDPYDALEIYRKNIVKSKEKIEGHISNVQNKLKKAKKPKTIQALNDQLTLLLKTQDSLDIGLKRVSESQSTIMREKMLEAKKLEDGIKFCRSKASVLAKEVYRDLKLPLLSFERNISKKVYEAKTDLLPAPQRKNSFSIPFLPLSHSLTTTEATPNGGSEPTSPSSSPRKRSLLNSVKDKVQTMRTSLKKSGGCPPLTISRSEDKIEVETNGVNHSSSSSNLLSSPLPETGKSGPGLARTLSSSSVTLSETAKKKQLIATKFFTEVEANKVPTRRSFVVKEFNHDIDVKNIIATFEDLAKADKKMQEEMSILQEGMDKLEMEFKNLEAEENGTSPSPSFANNDHRLLSARSATQRSRANTAPPLKAGAKESFIKKEVKESSAPSASPTSGSSPK